MKMDQIDNHFGGLGNESAACALDRQQVAL